MNLATKRKKTKNLSNTLAFGPDLCATDDQHIITIALGMS